MYAKMCERTHNALISQKYNHQIYKAVAISNINIKLWNLVHDAFLRYYVNRWICVLMLVY